MTTTEYRKHVVLRREEKSATSKRFEAEGLIVNVQDASFAGVELEITDYVQVAIEAETLERALEIANDALEYIQTHTGIDDRKENYIKIRQVD